MKSSWWDKVRGRAPVEVYGSNEELSTTASDILPELYQSWTEAEEKAVTRKIDFILLPIMAVALFALQIDRANMSAALSANLPEDIGIDTNQANTGVQLMGAAVLLAEIPCNIVLQWVGPRPWLSAQIFAWGLVATFQAFINNYGSFLATRALLGLMEAGFVPGALYYLSTWYKRDETSLRITLFFFGLIFSSATGHLVSAGLLSLDGTLGLAGWRWLFLIDGLITLAIGVVFTLTIPPAVGDGRSVVAQLCGRNYFSERESHILTTRVLLDDPRKARGKIHISVTDILNTLTLPRLWVHVTISMIYMSAFVGLSMYAPSMFKSFGFDRIRANELASVGPYCALFLIGFLSYFSDKTGERGGFMLIANVWALCAFCLVHSTPLDAGKWHRFGLLVFATIPSGGVHILNIAWVSVNCVTPQERSVSLAIMVMAANATHMTGAQIFREKDRPRYTQAFTTIIALAAVSCCLILLMSVAYRIWPRRALRVSEEAKVVQSEEIEKAG